MLPPGAVMGHEFAGTVVARGDEVTGVADGAQVAVLPAVRCGRCRTCLEGRDAICLEQGEYTEQAGSPYGIFRNFLQAPSDLPCAPPPWGMLTAVDLAAGTIRWQVL